MNMLMNFMAAGCPEELLPIVSFVKGIFFVIQIIIPVGLILMGSIDLGKAVLSSDDKEIKNAVSKLAKRAIAAVAIFFIVFIVQLVMRLVGESTDGSGFMECWGGQKVVGGDEE